jgi:hypothetical protein
VLRNGDRVLISKTVELHSTETLFANTSSDLRHDKTQLRVAIETNYSNNHSMGDPLLHKVPGYNLYIGG